MSFSVSKAPELFFKSLESFFSYPFHIFHFF